jgi:capsular exopolysaccharide synthesis family protein
MDLQFYLNILWRRKWIIIITILITELIVIIGTFLTVPIYSATTTLRIASASYESLSYYDYLYADRLMNTYVKLATTAPVIDELQQQLGLLDIPQIEVKAIPSTELIQISVESSDPNTAAKVVNSLAQILINQSLELYSGNSVSSLEILSQQVQAMEKEVNQARSEYLALVAENPGDVESIQTAQQTLDLKQQMYASTLEQYEQTRLKASLRANMISVVEPAFPPESPTKPNKIINIILGFFVGIVGGLGLAFVFENIDTTLYTSDQIETASELKVIGKIPSIRQRGISGLGNRTLRVNDSAYKESFQKLQTKINYQNTNGHTIKSLLITSAVPGEGKSTIVSNLAIAMGKIGQNVCIIDCDLRLPTQQKIFNLSNELGLSSILTQQSILTDVLQKCHNPNVSIITSGPVDSSPIELLQSPQMKSLIDGLVQEYDYVLLDTPALLPVGDALLLSTMVDAIALVVRQAYCKESILREACKMLIDLNTKNIGVIINATKQNGSQHYYSAKYHHYK